MIKLINIKIESSSTIEDKNSPDLKLLCVYVFDTLVSFFTKKEIDNCFPASLKNKSFPLFVTWSTGKNKKLRGCVGTFASNDLESSLKYYSLEAAFEDNRFDVILEKELPNLNVAVSLLTNFEDAKDCYDWELGKHGVQIFFRDGRNYSASFLPESPIEYNIDKITALKRLVKNSGYYRQFEDVEKIIQVRRFQSITSFMTYEEYCNFRK